MLLVKMGSIVDHMGGKKSLNCIVKCMLLYNSYNY